MRFYCCSESRIKEIVEKTKRQRRVLFLVGIGLLLTSVALMFWGIGISNSRQEILRVGCIASFVLACQTIQASWNSRKRVEKLHKRLSQLVVKLADDEIQIQYSKETSRTFARAEILRVEEPSVGGGLYLRSLNRYRWMLVPRSLDDYEEIKGELGRMGIPTAKKRIPTNSEEFLFVLLVCGALVCAGLVKNVYALEISLFVALLLIPTGLYMTRAIPENQLGRWKPIAFVLIPAFAVAFKLWIVLHR